MILFFLNAALMQTPSVRTKRLSRNQRKTGKTIFFPSSFFLIDIIFFIFYNKAILNSTFPFAISRTGRFGLASFGV